MGCLPRWINHYAHARGASCTPGNGQLLQLLRAPLLPEPGSGIDELRGRCRNAAVLQSGNHQICRRPDPAPAHAPKKRGHYANMNPRDFADLLPLVVLGYALAFVELVILAYFIARALFGRRVMGAAFRSLSKRWQNVVYIAICVLILLSMILLGIGMFAPSARLLGDIGAIGILIVGLIVELALLL